LEKTNAECQKKLIARKMLRWIIMIALLWLIYETSFSGSLIEERIYHYHTKNKGVKTLFDHSKQTSKLQPPTL